ncbi:Iron dicitrate transport regulator FecR [Planctomycetales bacterium 10988]|nr:Iron dicitrate transport regulator FecR [Planctomycetales bacterium 10988]
MKDEIEELERLLLAWEEGELDQAGINRFREILRTSERAREYYLQMQMLEVALKLEGEAGLGEMFQSDKPSVSLSEQNSFFPLKQGFTWKSLASLAAILLLGLLLGRLFYLETSEGDPELERLSTLENYPQQASQAGSLEATSQGVALITRLVEVEWADGQHPHEVGDALLPGILALDSGLVQIEFFCGATVILDGPAELELQTFELARLASGRLRAQVPPAARGFTIDVEEMKIVDLGTEFGLAVSQEGTDVQVFEGEVELHPASASKKILNAGEAMVRNAQGELSPSTASSDTFIDIATLEQRDQQQQEARFQSWQRWSQAFRRDPRLIAYYAFDEARQWERKLTSSVEPLDHNLDGAIVGADHTPGRWEAKGALEFKQPGDRVRVQIPGEYASLTFLCWAKIDSLDRWYNSLFLTDSYEQGEPHWQILDTGQLFFSVRASEKADKGPAHRPILSPPFWDRSLSGKWIHLATTYDVKSQYVTHYLNGEQLHRERLPDPQLVPITRFGAATLGNWSSPMRPDAHFAIRNLNGSIDEFAILSEAIAADEIQEIYFTGKP